MGTIYDVLIVFIICVKFLMIYRSIICFFRHVVKCGERFYEYPLLCVAHVYSVHRHATVELAHGVTSCKQTTHK